MNSVTFSKFLAIGLVLTVTTVGCRKGPKAPTPIPPATAKSTGPGIGQNSGPLVSPGPTVPGDNDPTRTRSGSDTGLPGDRDKFFGDMLMDREAFKQSTVYFALDSSTVAPKEKSKVDAVVSFLKGAPTNKVLIEGHCDERGTSEYNVALGERRALSIRDALIAAGISPDRINTLSFGEDKPAVMGNDESAYSKNRRGEFVLLTPKP
jgi:peptidoglycan-associated lipoprotein